MLFFYLFLSFFFIGLVGFGGPDSLQAFLESEIVVRRHWLTPDQYADLLAMGRLLPGEQGVNAATLAGWLAAVGTFGSGSAAAASAVATGALALPSLLWTAVASRFRFHHGTAAVKESMLHLLRPLVPGLMLAAILLIAKPENFGSPVATPWQFWISVFLFFATLMGSLVYRFNALFLVLLSGVAGWILL